MTRVGRWLILAAAVCLTATAAFGQEKPAEKPKTLLEEIVLFSNDLEEAYGAYKVPLGSGLTVKAGKFVTLLGYEVIESPNNLNFSRSFLFGLAIPFTHVGALLSYSPTEWLTVTAGPVAGWDVAKDNNDSMSVTGQFALTPLKDFTANFNWITGPEQASNTTHPRTVLDWTATYTGLKNVTLGANLDYGWEPKEASLVASGTRNDTDSTWGGSRGTGPTTGRSSCEPPCAWSTSPTPTGTLQYKIWRRLVGRLRRTSSTG